MTDLQAIITIGITLAEQAQKLYQMAREAASSEESSISQEDLQALEEQTAELLERARRILS